MTNQTIFLNALLIQPIGATGHTYSVFTENERGREQRREVTATEFWAIQEAAGEPSYTEPGYWTYDNRAIEWDDVLPPRSIY